MGKTGLAWGRPLNTCVTLLELLTKATADTWGASLDSPSGRHARLMVVSASTKNTQNQVGGDPWQSFHGSKASTCAMRLIVEAAGLLSEWAREAVLCAESCPQLGVPPEGTPPREGAQVRHAFKKFLR